MTQCGPPSLSPGWWQRREQDPGLLSPHLELIHLNTPFSSPDGSCFYAEAVLGEPGPTSYYSWLRWFWGFFFWVCWGAHLFRNAESFLGLVFLLLLLFCFKEKNSLLLGCWGYFKKQQKPRTFASQLPASISHWLLLTAFSSFIKKYRVESFSVLYQRGKET